MVGESVEHPQYGRGQVVGVYRGGAEWMVRFESGLRFRRPRAEFGGQASAPAAVTPSVFTPAAPMPQERFEARKLVEALRTGIAPAGHVRELTIGLEKERASLIKGLDEAHAKGGAVRAVVGDYGHGKSHIVELTAQEALAKEFLVATVSLDLLEYPPHKAFNIYSGLSASIRYPDTDERGLMPLLEAASNKNLQESLVSLTPLELDPLAVVLNGFSTTASTRQRRTWETWLAGGRKPKGMHKLLPKGSKFPNLYKTGNNARQIAYMLSGLSALAKLSGYRGLCVLIDEAESYSLLSTKQRPKAGLFFSTVIYAALGSRQAHIAGEDLPQHHLRDYPASYRKSQSLFFLFTVTRSDKRLPVEDWLEPKTVLELDAHHTPKEISEFLQTLGDYHAQAYAYEPSERHGQIRRAAAEHLALGMKNDRLSIRGVVRLATELYDLLYLYPDYDVAVMLEELRAQLR